MLRASPSVTGGVEAPYNMARLVQRLSFGLTLVGWAALAAAACSDSAAEEKAAAGVSQACTLNSDCSNPLVCAFQRCHSQCTETRDCDPGQRCVKESSKSSGAGGETGATDGVCQLLVEKTCASSGSKCAANQQCAEDKQCHDVCTSDSECFDRQTCTPTGSCAEMTEVDDTGNITPSGSGGSGGSSGGSAGKGGSMSNAGENGQSMGLGGDDGGNTVNECPDTKGNNPVEHQGETLSDSASWSGLHHISGSLYIAATLELKPCTVVQIDQGGSINLSTGGSIHALGVSGNPVVFTSSKSPPAPGDWGGINIQAAANNDSTFENVIIEYGGEYYSPLRVNDGAKASLSNVLVRHTGPDVCGIQLDPGASVVRFTGVSTEDSEPSLCLGANTVGSLDSFESDGVGISVQSETITEDATWHDFDVPYLVSSYLYVQGKLTLDPGVELDMPAGGWVDVNNGGSLQSLGSADDPVIFTSSKESPDAGDWGYLQFEASSSNDSLIDNTVIQYGAGTSVRVDNGASLGITNTTFRNTDDDGCAVAWAAGSRITDFDGIEFENTPCPIQVPASLVGELVDFSADEDSGDVSVQVETLTKAVTWSDHGSAYRLTGSMYTNAAWQLNAGVTIKMPSGGWLDASQGGSIKAVGTAADPVTFRSFIDDASDGDWQYIEIEATAAQSSSFTYTVIKDSTKGFLVYDNKLTLDHCTFENNTCDLQKDTNADVMTPSTEVSECM